MNKTIRICALIVALLATHLPACLADAQFPAVGKTYEITSANGHGDMVVFIQPGTANWYLVKRSEAYFQQLIERNPVKAGQSPSYVMPDLRPFWLNIDHLTQAREWNAEKPKPDPTTTH